MSVLTASAKTLFASTTARSCLAQQILDLGMHILASRSGMLLITKRKEGRSEVFWEAYGRRT